MNLTARAIPALFFLTAVLAAGASGQFEGIVESKNLTTDETGTAQTFVMSMFIKKDMVKIQNSAIGNSPASTMIYRNDRRVVWMLNEEEKSYFEIPQDQKPEEIQPPSGTPGSDTYKIRKTGKTKKILGYACEQMFIKREDEETEIWGTKSLGHLFNAITAALGQEHTEAADDWTNEIMKMGFFPLKATTKIEGKVAESQEVTRIEKRILPPDLFELPAGYKKQSVGEMMEGMDQK